MPALPYNIKLTLKTFKAWIKTRRGEAIWIEMYDLIQKLNFIQTFFKYHQMISSSVGEPKPGVGEPKPGVGEPKPGAGPF